jgi:hypothetical protein
MSFRVLKRTALETILLMSSDNDHASSQEIILELQRAVHLELQRAVHFPPLFTHVTEKSNIICNILKPGTPK